MIFRFSYISSTLYCDVHNISIFASNLVLAKLLSSNFSTITNKSNHSSYKSVKTSETYCLFFLRLEHCFSIFRSLCQLKIPHLHKINELQLPSEVAILPLFFLGCTCKMTVVFLILYFIFTLQ